MGKREIETFLTHLAVNRAVSPATKNQALQALLFLPKQVLEVQLPWLDDVVRAKPKRKLAAVLTTNFSIRCQTGCFEVLALNHLARVASLISPAATPTIIWVASGSLAINERPFSSRNNAPVKKPVRLLPSTKG